MPKPILIEEFHLSVYAPQGLPDVRYQAIRESLDAARFQVQLRRAIGKVTAGFPSLSSVRVRISR